MFPSATLFHYPILLLDREFFMLKPEEALEQMKVVAEGLEATVTQFDENGNIKKVFDYTVN